MGSFVLDSSVALAWCFDDEVDAYAESILDRLSMDGVESALVPSLWPVEMTNILMRAEKKKRIPPGRAASLLFELPDLRIEIEPIDVARMPRVLELAGKLDLTAYDALYLELSIRRGLPLATLDADLRVAAAAAGVSAA